MNWYCVHHALYADYIEGMRARDKVLEDAVLAYYGLEDKNVSNHNAGDDDNDDDDDDV